MKYVESGVPIRVARFRGAASASLLRNGSAALHIANAQMLRLCFTSLSMTQHNDTAAACSFLIVCGIINFHDSAGTQRSDT